MKNQVPTTSVMLEDDAPVPVAAPKEQEKRTTWIDDMLSCYEVGMSDVEVCKELRITRKQFEQHCADIPEFAALVERGRDYSEAWWLEQGRKNLKNKEFVTALWQFNVVNRLGWSSKRESAAPEAHLNLDKLRDELRKALPDLARTLNVVTLDDARQAVVKSITSK